MAAHVGDLDDSFTLFHEPVDGILRVATVREKYLEIEIFSRLGKSQRILWMVREI